MNRTLRRAHRRLLTALAILLPLLVWIALLSRHEPPVQPLPPALARSTR